MAENYPVRTSDSIRDLLKELHNTNGLTFREIALTGDFLSIPPGTLCAITKGYPIPHKWRERLGLLPEANIVVIYGKVPAGAQAIQADQCACGQWFISNHPARKRCFICSPFKRKANGRTK